MSTTTRIKWTAAAIAAALVVTACGSGGGGSGTGAGAVAGAVPTQAVDKAGALPAPITLRLGTEDDEGRPGSDQIRAFAQLVSERTDGRIVIEPVWDANGENNRPGWDQEVARMVVSGELDMGMIPARAWDTEGVSSLRALHAPFLVDTDELSAAIAKSDLAGEMLAGLEAIGVTGLALAPESLRHLLVYGDVPETVDDFKGLAVRSPRSATTYALFEALGAKPDDFTDPGESLDAFIETGQTAAAEASFALASLLPGGATIVGNLPLFPKVNSLVINTAALDRLSADQQAALRDAAAQLVEDVTATAVATAEHASRYCRNGGSIVLADDTLLDELRSAVEPVYADLEGDPATKSLIERIRALRDEVDAPSAVVVPCTSAAEETPNSSADPAETATFPEGAYRKEVTVEELVAAGVDRPTAFNHKGTWVLTFKDGKFIDPGCPDSVYSVSDGRITVTLGPTGEGCGDAAGKVLFSAGWTLDGDTLQLTDVRSGHGSDLLIAALFGGKPFTKID